MNKLTGKETELSLLPQVPTVSKSRGHGLLPTCNSIWIQHIINTHWSPCTESFAFPATALEWIDVGIKPLLLRVWIQNKRAWSRAVHARSERTGSKIPASFLLRKLPSLLSRKPSGPGKAGLPVCWGSGGPGGARIWPSRVEGSVLACRLLAGGRPAAATHWAASALIPTCSTKNQRHSFMWASGGLRRG